MLAMQAEYEAWKLRELKRIKRERKIRVQEAEEARETERRRNLTNEEREAEDKCVVAPCCRVLYFVRLLLTP